MNNNLIGIVIDPGHGGSDSGALGKDLKEKDYNLTISKYMYDRFKELGVPVTLTRDSDITLSPSDRTRNILAAYGNNPNVIVISNHLNAGGGTGAEVIYALRNSSQLAQQILSNIGDTGITTRKIYQKRLPSNNDKDYYFIHRETGQTEPVIVEYGFIDNDKDVDFLTENYKDLAEAVIKAVLNYKNIPYTPPSEISTDTYRVAKGDTLYSIANKLGITVNQLKNINNLKDNEIKIGQVLKIPKKTIPEESSFIYTIKAGDTLYKIAQNYNTTVDKLKEINNLTSNDLKIGQSLSIPSGLVNFDEYNVQKGDSLYSIAKKFNTTVDKIKELNNLTNNILTVGQILKIPTEEETEKIYTVKSGDTIYSIAKKNNINIELLKSANDLTSNLLTVGQKLIIPEETTTMYKVQKGDNLYSIARKFNTTVSELKQLNDLKTDILTIGQLLLIR